MTRFDAMGLGKLVRATALRTSYVVALLCAVLTAPSAYGYQYYNDGSGEGCVSCHAGFTGGNSNSLHFVHVSKFDVATCNLCHPSGAGSKPVRTYWSGAGGGYGCAGCHGQDYGEMSTNPPGQAKASGYGLRLFHANHGVAECAGCHSPNPFPPLGEDVPPPYYDPAFSNLTDPCFSSQEDTSFDLDLIGLDNDGDGAADYPADSDCMVAPPTTTTMPVTTTTMPNLSCAPSPATGCIAPGKAVLLVSEKTAGKEKLKVKLVKLQSTVTQDQFGDPVSGNTAYTVCIYDASDQLSGEIIVDRGGQICGSLSCWAPVSDKGYKYLDKGTTTDGILKMLFAGGDAGKGKISVIGKNATSTLPTGIAPLLQNDTQATIRVLASDGACFGATLTQVKKADGSIFSAVGP